MDVVQIVHSAIVPFAFGSGVGSFLKLPSCPQERPCEVTCNCGSFADGFGISTLCCTFALGALFAYLTPRIAASVRSWRTPLTDDSVVDFASVARAQAAKTKK